MDRALDKVTNRTYVITLILRLISKLDLRLVQITVLSCVRLLAILIL